MTQLQNASSSPNVAFSKYIMRAEIHSRGWRQYSTIPSNCLQSGVTTSAYIHNHTQAMLSTPVLDYLWLNVQKMHLSIKSRMSSIKKAIAFFWKPIYFTCSDCFCCERVTVCVCVLEWTLWVSDVPCCLRGSRTGRLGAITHTDKRPRRYTVRLKQKKGHWTNMNYLHIHGQISDTEGKVCVLTDSSHHYPINVETDRRAICCQASCTAVTFYFNARLQHWAQWLVDNHQIKILS